MSNRIAVMHGVNLDQLGDRDPLIYGGLTLLDLQSRIAGFAGEFDLRATFFQTNHEGELVEQLHRAREVVDGIVINAGAWTHYSYAIRDALEFTELPFVEVHLSDVTAREPWRSHSVFADVPTLVGEVHGKGPDGYREAIAALAERLKA